MCQCELKYIYFFCFCILLFGKCNIILCIFFAHLSQGGFSKKKASTSSSPSTKFINLCQKLKRNGSVQKYNKNYVRKKNNSHSFIYSKKRKFLKFIQKKTNTKGDFSLVVATVRRNQVKWFILLKRCCWHHQLFCGHIRKYILGKERVQKKKKTGTKGKILSLMRGVFLRV